MHASHKGLFQVLALSLAFGAPLTSRAQTTDVPTQDHVRVTTTQPQPLLEALKYTGPYNYYGEFGVGGMESGDFDGFTLSARTGIHFGEKLQDALEFEFLFAKLTTSVRSLSGPDLRVSGIFGGSFLVADNLVKGQGDLEEYMLMLNYRYGGTLNKKVKIPYYIGFGGGINLMDFRNKKQRFTTIVGTTAPVNVATKTIRDFDIAPVGQIFAGTGVFISDNVAIMVRGRALLTPIKERVKIGKLDNLQTVASSDYYQLGAEVVLSVIF
ncbi:MAG TPA: hypothetical protein DIU37_00880 [Opitutae bacterium]|nr:hypothetical protein [Opitutae bacterium]|tara:strand:+ start:728 stop:1531 length:804 start_codon:yes stop_codon:yes gene_type:complete